MPPHGIGIAADYDESELGKVWDARLARRLWNYLHPYRYLVFLAIALAIATAGLRVAGPWFIREIINKYIPTDTPESRAGFHLYAGFYIGTMFVMFFANFALAYITAWVGQQSMKDLRSHIFRKLHELPLSYHDHTPSGRLLTRATSDVQVLDELFGQGVVSIFADLVLLVGIIIAWMAFDWKLALVLLLSGPIIGVVSYNFRVRARSAYREVRKRIAALNAFLQENLAGIRTVQSFCCESKHLKRYSEMNALYRDAQIETVQHFARFFPLVDIISNLTIVVVLIYGGLHAKGLISVGGRTLAYGDIYLYIQYIGWFFMPITNLAERYNVFQAAMASSERIFELLDEPVTISDAPDAIEADTLRDSVELRNVRFAYNNEDWVLRDVSMQVKKGDVVALVGATGAGKSTTISLLNRLYDVQHGEVLYDGRDVRSFKQDSLRRRMAIVLQDVFLFSGTIADNIRLGNRDMTDEQIVQAAKYANADAFIARLPKGYDHEVLERGATLSTGQKQLLALARAVAFEPDLLILDEATANIDTETEALIQEALARILHGRTSIVVAHRLSTIQNADKIIVFHHGCIHEQGSHQDLLRRDGLYRRLYELQYKSRFPENEG
jgi:ATP-binding cassette subfamily B multidrug efflux pump